MTGYALLIQAFVEGKIQDRFARMAEQAGAFAEEIGPELEHINTSFTRFWNRRLSSVTSKDMENILRVDAESARKYLPLYNRMYGMLDTNLSMVASNFSLPRFLAENGIAQAQIAPIQEELRAYFDETYGALAAAYWRMREAVGEMRENLTVQIQILDGLYSKDYFTAWRSSEELREAFANERTAFGRFRKEMALISSSGRKMEAQLKVQAAKTRETVRAHLLILKGTVKADLQESEDRVSRAILVLAYAAGCVGLLFKIRSMLITKGFSKLIKVALLDRKNKRVRVLINAMEGSCSQLSFDVLKDNIDDAIRAYERLYAAL